MQNKMPERFYAKHDMKNGWTAWALYPDRIEGTVEYIRADIMQEKIRTLALDDLMSRDANVGTGKIDHGSPLAQEDSDVQLVCRNHYTLGHTDATQPREGAAGIDREVRKEAVDVTAEKERACQTQAGREKVAQDCTSRTPVQACPSSKTATGHQLRLL